MRYNKFFQSRARSEERSLQTVCRLDGGKEAYRDVSRRVCTLRSSLLADSMAQSGNLLRNRCAMLPGLRADPSLPRAFAGGLLLIMRRYYKLSPTLFLRYSIGVKNKRKSNKEVGYVWWKQ